MSNQTQQTPNKPINLSTDYPDVTDNELRDILDALMVIRNSTRWGKIEIVILGNDIDMITVEVTKKRKNKV